MKIILNEQILRELNDIKKYNKECYSIFEKFNNTYNIDYFINNILFDKLIQYYYNNPEINEFDFLNYAFYNHYSVSNLLTEEIHIFTFRTFEFDYKYKFRVDLFNQKNEKNLRLFCNDILNHFFKEKETLIVFNNDILFLQSGLNTVKFNSLTEFIFEFCAKMVDFEIDKIEFESLKMINKTDFLKNYVDNNTFKEEFNNYLTEEMPSINFSINEFEVDKIKDLQGYKYFIEDNLNIRITCNTRIFCKYKVEIHKPDFIAEHFQEFFELNETSKNDIDENEYFDNYLKQLFFDNGGYDFEFENGISEYIDFDKEFDFEIIVKENNVIKVY